MEFPEINMISDFEAGVKCLQRVPQVHIFWKWGALILAILATFSSIIKKIKLLFIYIRKIKPSTEPLLQYLGEDFDFSDDDDDYENDKCSSLACSDSDDEEEDFVVSGSSFYFRENGCDRNLKFRGRNILPWTEYSAGKNVVKLWDSLGLGFDYEYEDLSKSVVSLWDMNQEEKIRGNLFSDFSEVSSVTMASPAVVLSSEVKNERNGVVLAGYDMRMKSKAPVMYADWCSSGAGKGRAGKVVGVNGSGAGKVYVGDMRNVKTPLEKLTEIDDDTWWDADAVIVDEKFDASN